MTTQEKAIIAVLNDLIEYSKDGEKGLKDSAQAVKNPELKAFFVQRAAKCATAASELQTEVRRRGGDPETSTSVSGDLNRGWVNLRSLVTGKDDEAVLNEVERGESHALRAHREAREKLVKLGLGPTDSGYALVEKHLQAVQKNHDEVEMLRDAGRARG